MRRLSGAAGWLRRIPPVPGLAVLVALQLALAFWFAFKTPHNGWIWYSGGDATEYWTEQWSIAHLLIPQSVIGWGLPVFYAWVPLVTGTTLLSGAAVIVLFQAIVLVPLGLVLFWLVADRLFGRVYAWVCAAVWVAGPLLMLHGFVHRYHPAFDQNFLVPHWFGFTNMADLPSLVAVLAAAWFLLRAVDEESVTDAVLSAIVYGVALGLKPSNGFFVLPVAVLLAATRRKREALYFGAALVPALITLLLWKARGLGHVPLTTSSYEQIRMAAGVSTPVAVTTSKYVQFNWHHLQQELSDLREVFWSLRFLEFLLFAGTFGVIRKRPSRGLFVVAWFAAYGLFKGSNLQAGFNTTSWYRLAEPGLPAYILLAVGVAFCLPRLGRRVEVEPAPRQPTRLNVRLVGIVGGLVAGIPLLLMVVAQPASSMRIARDNEAVNEAPLSDSFHLEAKPGKKLVHFSWQSPYKGKTRPLFRIFVSGNGNGCHRPSSGSDECFLKMERYNPTSATSTVVPRLPRAAHWYRVGMIANYKFDKTSGDLMLLSPPIRVLGLRR